MDTTRSINDRKWRIVDERSPQGGRREGRIEAVARTTIMGFRDDVVIRVRTVGGGASRIVNPAGEIVAEAAGDFKLAVSDIDLNREWRTKWLSIGPGLGEGKSLFIKERRPDTYSGVLASPK